MEEPAILLDIRNLSVAYGNQVLFKAFTLQLKRGETACIQGPSGCGKTSLLNAVLGFAPVSTGHISLNGIPMKRDTLDVYRRQIAWIPQELALPLEWVREMVQLPFDLKANRNTPFSEQALFACFDQLGLEHELYHKRVSEISGGQRQRIMIAVASMLQKPLTVVDEPTSALDACSTGKVLEFLKGITRRGGSVLAVSHDHTFCQGCDLRIKL